MCIRDSSTESNAIAVRELHIQQDDIKTGFKRQVWGFTDAIRIVDRNAVLIEEGTKPASHIEIVFNQKYADGCWIQRHDTLLNEPTTVIGRHPQSVLPCQPPAHA